MKQDTILACCVTMNSEYAYVENRKIDSYRGIKQVAEQEDMKVQKT